ncbi:MAG TPA: MgtC/SapB family protein [bacterium]|nr:MgtC/SapB family protein [bacterium]
MEIAISSHHLFQIFLQLALAAVLGAFIGIERELRKKEAGLRTYTLVSLGACIFTIIALHLAVSHLGIVDPGRVIQAIAIGIGFIGGGVIFQRPSRIEGLTTAAGLWVAGAVGVGVGIGSYSLAILATLFTVFILVGFGFLEKRFFKKEGNI